MKQAKFVTVNGMKVAIEGEKNLLNVIRKAGIDIPTFCYHSELSVYGACRMCVVEVEGRGVQASCSLPPEDGMVIQTHTEKIRNIRKTNMELLLASGKHECTTCGKGPSCQLLNLAQRLGVDTVRFERVTEEQPQDMSSPSIVRDPNRCILCGDCVRMCAEVQGIGAIDFAFRGSKSAVLPAFGKNLGDVECVNCGQCVAVCPTGALLPRSEVNEVWQSLNQKDKIVVAQVAPAVRVALGEMFGMGTGEGCTGQMVAALKMMGFDYIFDTSFTADLTVLEEATEFLHRVEKGGAFPMMTSCCPGWVKFCEQYYPEYTQNLSTCRSPQQMFGSLMKNYWAKTLQKRPEDIVVVSIMPCTAKKFEAKREEFYVDGIPDVDHVLTTIELGKMIQEKGLNFRKLRPESFDLPFGFKTGAGVIFGNSGGVTEAVLRYLGNAISSSDLPTLIQQLHGTEDIRELKVKAGEHLLNMVVVHSLAAAKQVMEEVKKGKKVDFIEVMACPGGCIGGGGQPVLGEDYNPDTPRTQGLRDNDKMLQVHSSEQNPYIQDLYTRFLGEIGGHTSHDLLHTHYGKRKRMISEKLTMEKPAQVDLKVDVCLGTGCYVRGAQDLLYRLMMWVDKESLGDRVEVSASFCFESCDRGPVVRIGEKILEKCTLEMASNTIKEALKL